MNMRDPGFRAIIGSLRAQDAAHTKERRLAEQQETATAAQRARQQNEERRLQMLAGERVASIAVAVAGSALHHGVPFDLRAYTRIRPRRDLYRPPREIYDYEGSKPTGAWFLEHFGPGGYEPFDGPRSSSPGYVLDREGAIRSLHESPEGKRPVIAQLIATEGLTSFEPLLARFVIDRNLQP